MLKFSKKVILGTIVGSLLLTGTALGAVKAYDKWVKVRFANIKLVVDGKTIQTKAEPFIYNGNVYAPVATVANMLGIKQEWDNKTPAVRFTDRDKFGDILFTTSMYQVENRYKGHEQLYNVVYLVHDNMTETFPVIGITNAASGKHDSFPDTTPDGKKIDYRDFIEGTERIGSIDYVKDKFGNGEFAMLERIEGKSYFTYYSFVDDKLKRLDSTLIETPEGSSVYTVTSDRNRLIVTLIGKISGVQTYDIKGHVIQKLNEFVTTPPSPAN